MTKVITYGTYDMLHYGHIRLLERAKALGDYLIVGVTADDFDKTRGKINVKQSLMERIEAVKATGLADEIIVEEYEGQKIDDIQRYDIDIFTVGSDWVGKFDYLNEYCKVIYLNRTEGISSSEIRSNIRMEKMGLAGNFSSLKKIYNECQFVNGVSITCVFTENKQIQEYFENFGIQVTSNYSEMLNKVDIVYIASHPSKRYEHSLAAIEKNKHILCESPVSLSKKEYINLRNMAKKRNVIFFEAIKTAYSTAYNRLLLLIKTGKIGKVLSVDATCTSLVDFDSINETEKYNTISDWGPIGILPVLQILGTDYKKLNISSLMSDTEEKFDLFSKIDFIYDHSVATVKVGKGVKSEGELVISGTNGYIYVPAPWWKMDYFEIRYENQNENKRYFYQLDGEGIRYEIVAFVKAIESGKIKSYIEPKVTETISSILEQFEKGEITKL